MKTVDLQDHMTDLVNEGRKLVPEITDDISKTNVHQLRVCVRRLRTCLSLLDHKLPGKDKKRLKKLWRHLGEVRDLDVAKDLSEENSLPVDVILRARKKERKDLQEFLRDKKTERLFDEMEKLALKKEAASVSPSPAIAKLREELIRTPASARHLHAIRILLKKIRYLREALRFPVEAFKDVQDLIGEYQDLSVLREHHPDHKGVQELRRKKEEAVLFLLKGIFSLAFRSLMEMERRYSSGKALRVAS